MGTTTIARCLRSAGLRLIAAAVAWIGIVGGYGPARAQRAPGSIDATQIQMQRPVSIDAKKTSLLEVVDLLMKQVHANYTFDSQLQEAPIGAIHLTKVPFRTALEIALKASSKAATYRFEAGVYMVVARAEEPAALPGPAQLGFMPGVGQTALPEKARVTATEGDAPGQPNIQLSVENGDLYTTLNLLFKEAHAQFTLDAGLRQVFVTANFNQPFRTALETLLRASGKPLTYKLENGIYSIVSKTDGDGLPGLAAEPTDPSRIKLEVENGDLYTALKLLFAQAHMQFTLDPALKKIFVTVRLDQPFQQALETLLRASGQGLTYKVENDVYSIIPSKP